MANKTEKSTGNPVSKNMDPSDLYRYYVKDALGHQLQSQKKYFKELMILTLLVGIIAYLLIHCLHGNISQMHVFFEFVLFQFLVFSMAFLTSRWSALHDVTKTKRMLHILKTQTFTYKIYHNVHIIIYGDSCVAQCQSGEFYKISPSYSGHPDTDLLIIKLCGEILVHVLDPIMN